MMLTRAALSEYDSRIRSLGDAAYGFVRERIASFMAKFPGATVADTRDFAIESVNAAVLTYGDAASTCAADLYDQMAESAGATLPPAVLDTSAVAEYIEKEIRYQAGKLVAGKPAEFAEEAARSAKAQTQRRANDTMTKNVKRDGVRYARVPLGFETCTFCLMLASRGFAYTSAKTAGAHYHDNCRCKVVPSFGKGGKATKVEGYDPDELRARWEEFERIDADKSMSGKEKKAAKAALNRGNSIDRNNQVYSGIDSKYVDMVERLVAEANGDCKNLYLSYEPDFKKTAVDKSGCYFLPYDGRTYFDDFETVFGGKRKEAGDTWFHELGHNIDFLEGGGKSISSTWRGGAFQAQIKKEVAAYAKKRKPETKAYVEKMVRDGNLRELSDDWKLIDFTTYMEALRGELSDKEVIERCGKITLNHTYKMIGREVSELPDAEKHALSDILGGATGNRAIDSWGHWKKSYWDKYGNALAQEAFAEMFAGNISSPRAMEKLREYLPESCKMFDEMVKEIADARIE